jgi:hypothetical protein
MNLGAASYGVLRRAISQRTQTDDGRGLAVGRADRVGGVGEQHGEA